MTDISFGQINSLSEALENPNQVKHLKLNISDNDFQLDGILNLKELNILEVYCEDGVKIEIPVELYNLKKLNSISLQGTNISSNILNTLDRYENLQQLYINDQTDYIQFPKQSKSLKKSNNNSQRSKRNR